MRVMRMAVAMGLLGLLVAVTATAAFAQDRQEIDDFESGVVRDFDGDLGTFCPDYPAGDCLLVLVEVEGPECEAALPELRYSVHLGPGVVAESVDVTFVAEGAEARHEGQPLSGALLWPGVEVQGEVVEWPGWTWSESGWTLDDTEALEFPLSDVHVRFAVDQDTYVEVAAPALDPDGCAAEVEEVVLVRDPPAEPEPTEVLGVSLPRTGASVLALLGIGVGVLGLGLAVLGVLITAGRRRSSTGA